MNKKYVVCVNKQEKLYYSQNGDHVNINNARHLSLSEVRYSKSQVLAFHWHFMEFNEDGRLIDVPWNVI
jgi:hypothetical protein